MAPETRATPICQAWKLYVSTKATEMLLDMATRKPMLTARMSEAHRADGRMIRANGRTAILNMDSDV